MKAKSTLKAARLIRKSRLTYLSLALVVGLILGLTLFAVAWAADGVTLGGYTFKFNGVTYNAEGTSTWSYTVTPPGSGNWQDLSHWVLGLCEPPDDPTVVSSNPAGSKGTDPPTGLYGIKWEQGIKTTEDSVVHSFVLDGWYDVVEVDVVQKAGPKNFWGKIDGPSCDTCSTSINVIKELFEPETDPGKFDLQIDGVTERDEACHGDSTGAKTVSVGDHTVGETADGETDMDDYAFDISCVDGEGNPVTATQQGSDASWTIYVGPCQDVVCTITNEYVGDPTAVTLSSFAAESSVDGSVSPLWLGLTGLTVLAAGSLFWAKRKK